MSPCSSVQRGSEFVITKRVMQKTRIVVELLLLLGASGSLWVQAQNESLPASPHPTGPYRIAGVVVNAKTGSPLAGASVQIQDAKNWQSVRAVTTSDDGHFEFRVMAGKFGLRGARHGFITSYYEAHGAFSSAVVTGVGLETEHLRLRLPPDAVLGGKVLDENGEPVRGADVHIYREDRSTGIGRITSVDTTTTDDQGSYEATPLAQGTYFVAVNATPWYAVHPVTGHDAGVDRSLDVAYPITYYGDVAQPDEATPIPVRGGDHLEANIHLSPLPALHLTLHFDSDRGPGPSMLVPTFDGYEEIRSGGALISPGLYEIIGIAPGKYQVRIPNASGELQEPKEMEIAGGIDLDTLSSRPVGSVTVTVQMRDGGKVPDQLLLALRPANSVHQVDWRRVNGNQASFSDVAPGRYDLLAATNDRGYSVVSTSSGDAQSSGKTVEVSSGASLEISASIVGGMSNIEGVAKRESKPVSGAMIVLVPENPDANQELFRRDESDLDGTFTLLNVVPGSYTVVAIEDGWDLDWAKAAVLSRFLPKGERIQVGDQTEGSIHLPHPVQVQGK
jgi:carboxypeptidase family protein